MELRARAQPSTANEQEDSAVLWHWLSMYALPGEIYRSGPNPPVHRRLFGRSQTSSLKKGHMEFYLFPRGFLPNSTWNSTSLKWEITSFPLGIPPPLFPMT